MAEQGLDALVLAQPENITYATGAFPGVATLWRRAGAALLLVPADPAIEVTAIVGDLQAASFKNQTGIRDVRVHRLWVETGLWGSDEPPPDDVPTALTRNDTRIGKPARSSRPAQYTLDGSLGLLRDRFIELGLENSRVGLEMGFVPVADFSKFQKILPDIDWIDSTRLIEKLRSIKSPAEREKLILAAELSRAGIGKLIEGIEPGTDAARLASLWREGVSSEADKRSIPMPGQTWSYIAVAGDGFAPGEPASVGDIIKIDVGCVIDGYSSDCGRTAVLGQPSRPAQKVYDALKRAFDRGLATLRPGIELAAVYRSVAHTMWDQGFATYGRGHFGHGLGASIWSEEWPFISADAEAVAEPGMILAFETPYYIKGLGGFIIEDQLIIDEKEVKIIAPFSRDLIIASI